MRGVGYAEGGGTLREKLNTREKQSYEKQVGGVERSVSSNKLFYTFSCCFALFRLWILLCVGIYVPALGALFLLEPIRGAVPQIPAPSTTG